jgi:hypothetical protein
LFTCVASCSFAFDLGVKFKFGLAFALVLIVFSGSAMPPRRLPSTVSRFLFLLWRPFFFFLLHQVCFICVIIWLRFCHVPEFYDAHVLFFIFCAFVVQGDVATYDLLKKWKKTN